MIRYRITNHTRWRTADLRRFVVRAGRTIFKPEHDGGAYRIEFTYNRAGSSGTYVTGLAWRRAGKCRIMVPSGEIDRVSLAGVIAHEFGHLIGIGHKQMRNNPARWWRERAPRAYAEMYAWGESLPLGKKPERAKPAGPGVAERRRAAIAARLARWESKHRRAANAIKKLRARLRYYDRRAAAAGKPGGDA